MCWDVWLRPTDILFGMEVRQGDQFVAMTDAFHHVVGTVFASARNERMPHQG